MSFHPHEPTKNIIETPLHRAPLISAPLSSVHKSTLTKKLEWMTPSRSIYHQDHKRQLEAIVIVRGISFTLYLSCGHSNGFLFSMNDVIRMIFGEWITSLLQGSHQMALRASIYRSWKSVHSSDNLTPWPTRIIVCMAQQLISQTVSAAVRRAREFVALYIQAATAVYKLQQT